MARDRAVSHLDQGQMHLQGARAEKSHLQLSGKKALLGQISRLRPTMMQGKDLGSQKRCPGPDVAWKSLTQLLPDIGHMAQIQDVCKQS